MTMMYVAYDIQIPIKIFSFKLLDNSFVVFAISFTP